MATSSIGTAWIQIKPSLQGVSREIEQQLGGELDRSLGKSNSAFSKFSTHGIEALNKIGKFGFTALAATATATVALIGSRISSAVKRIDTLNNFPRVLQAMGATGADATAATEKLSKALQGLPTGLDAGAQGVQQLVVAGLTVPKATDAFLALNNALIASGAGAAQVDSAMLAFSQSLSRGRIDGQEWNSLLSTMPVAFGALQKATGKTTLELKELFQNDPKGLIDNLIKLNQDGGGGLESLEKQARSASGGIGTAMSMMGSAIDRGWQSLVTALGGGDLQAGSKKISDFIVGIGTGIEKVMKGVGEWVASNGPLINNVLIPALQGIAAAITLITIGFITASLIAGGWTTVIIAAIMSLYALATVIAANWSTIMQVVGSFFTMLGQWIATAWNSIMQFFINIGLWAMTAWSTVTSVFAGVAGWFSGVFGAAWNGIKAIFSNVGGFFRGVWNTIVSIFGQVGTAIGNAISGAVKGVVNSILGFAQNTINGFVRAINTAVDIINAIPGVSISRITELNIPRLATGGPVFGGGGPTSDKIPAMLSNGEYVIRAAAAKSIGYSNLDQINRSGTAGGSFTMGDIIVQGYNKDPKELANEISGIIARQRARVMG